MIDLLRRTWTDAGRLVFPGRCVVCRAATEGADFCDDCETGLTRLENRPQCRDCGSPLAVAFRLVLLSILVGVVLAAIGFDPWNIITSIRLLFQRLWDLGFDAVNWLWRYFLLGAVIVIPIWLLSRVFGAPRGR